MGTRKLAEVREIGSKGIDPRIVKSCCVEEQEGKEKFGSVKEYDIKSIVDTVSLVPIK